MAGAALRVEGRQGFYLSVGLDTPGLVDWPSGALGPAVRSIFFLFIWEEEGGEGAAGRRGGRAAGKDTRLERSDAPTRVFIWVLIYIPTWYPNR